MKKQQKHYAPEERLTNAVGHITPKDMLRASAGDPC